MGSYSILSTTLLIDEKRPIQEEQKNILTYMMCICCVEFFSISLCVSHLNIFAYLYILTYHDGFSRHKTTVSAQIVIHRNSADLLYALYCTLLYCTVLHLLY